jgi:hypothetical protein
MPTKTCTSCGRELPATTEFFHCDPDGRYDLHPKCKVCLSERRAAYYAANQEKCRTYSRKYDQAHPDKNHTRSQEYHRAHAAEILLRKEQYRAANWERCRQIERDSYERHKTAKNRQSATALLARYHRDPTLRLSMQMGNAMRAALYGRKGGRPWESLLGYTLTDLVAHLEARFQPGMAWENYGQWHIDHIRPVASFDFMTPDDPAFGECWALANLQPLWAVDNLRKGARVDGLL